MAENNKHNMLYFEGQSMQELHNNMDEWQKKNEKRFLSMTVNKDGDNYCCIALTNPSEVIIVDGQAAGGAQVGLIEGVNHLATRPQKSCFPARATILTSTGLQYIKNIKKGDMVVTYNDSGETRLRPVTRKIKHNDSPIVCLMLNDGTKLRATSNHTMLTKRGWLRIDNIKKGDYLVRKEDSVCVTDIIKEINSEPVYNLYTAFEHTFIVDGVIAHNFSTLRVFRTWLHKNLIDHIYYLFNKRVNTTSMNRFSNAKL